MIDLQQFCWTGVDRDMLKNPFSLCDRTYATNGHIIVIVPRRTDIPEYADAPNVKKALENLTWGNLSPVNVVLPPPTLEEECINCNGSGREHECPDCECPCETCDGKGVYRGCASVRLRGGIFNLEYVRQILALPGLRLANDCSGERPVPFAFDGGKGALMGMRYEHIVNHDLEEAMA